MADNNTIPALTGDDNASTPPQNDNSSPTGSDDIRNFVAEKLWCAKIQDQGFSLEEDTPASEVKKKTRGAYKGPDGRYYKDLYKMGKELLDKWQGHWPGLSTKNSSEGRRAIAKAIHSHRISKPRSEVDDQDTLDAAPDDQETVHLLKQDDIINHMWCLWIEKPAMQTHIQVNDRIRVFGILAREENRDFLQQLGVGTARNRAELDDPAQRMSTRLNEIAEQFNNKNIQVSHPPRKEKLVDHEKLDPNEVDRIKIKRDGKWVKTVFAHTLTQYNRAWVKWIKGTGGGPGMPEDYVNWQTREQTELFSNYDDSGRHYLAWIYMVDKQLGFLFNVKNSAPPANSVIEGPHQQQTENDGGVGNRRAKRLSPRNNAMIQSFKAASGELGGSIERALSQSSSVLAEALVARPSHDVPMEELERIENLKRRYREDPDLDAAEKREWIDRLNHRSRSILAKAMPLP